jgi:hypothetical protein
LHLFGDLFELYDYARTEQTLNLLKPDCIHNIVCIKSHTNCHSDALRHALKPSSGSSALMQFLLNTSE